MGLFNFFKKPIIVQDDFFGALHYIKSKHARDSYFEGSGFFIPTQNTIEYFIQADESGPTDQQKKFYREFQENFDVYVKKIVPLIEDEFRNWKADFAISKFNDEFKLVSITIPRFENSPAIWELSFTSILDLNHEVTIDFIENEPSGIIIDG